MPELPEVEVLRRSLAPALEGRTVTGIRVWSRALREPVDRRRLAAAALDRRILGLRRRAKYLLIDLEGDRTLAVHLGMSGRLTLAPRDAPREDHEHVALELDSGRRLRLRDPRRFGLFLALPTTGLERDRHFRHLGIEPLDNGFSGEALRRRARGRRGPVKAFLMDARAVVGVGNIYAAEALHRAGIHPRRSVARIAAPRWERLARAVVATLRQAIAEGGTTLNDFADGQGREGLFQVSLAVYGRAGEPCSSCRGAIRRIEIGGRGTFYCARCQR